MGELWLARGDTAKARDWVQRCIQLAAQSNSRKYLVKGGRLKAEIHLIGRQLKEAEVALSQALNLAKLINNPTQLWKTHLALGQLCRDTRRADPARASFEATRNVIDDIGHSLRTPELKNGFERSPLIQDVYEQCRRS